jgi:hypothetical protein
VRYGSGEAIPETTTARDLLNLKRGVGKLKDWDAKEARISGPIIDQVYGAMDGELDSALPGFARSNREYSTMLKIGQHAEAVLNNAGVLQRTMSRLGKPTGALVSSGLGAGAGYAVGGPAGAAAGAVATPFLQEAFVSPTVRMAAARGLKVLPRAVPPKLIPLSALLGRQEDQ